MKRASITEAKNKLSALLDRVKRGEAILITDRDIPVARLVPAISVEDLESQFSALVSQGILELPIKALSKDFYSAIPKAGQAANILHALLSNREEDR